MNTNISLSTKRSEITNQALFRERNHAQASTVKELACANQ
jgi:hypothetical protein